MKYVKSIVLLLPLMLIFLSCTNKLSTEKTQIAVDKALDWTKKGGSVKVTGIRELPQENAAQVDLDAETE